MDNSKKTFRPKARVAKGFRDVGPDEIRGLRAMLATIQGVYESYGFEPVEQPFVEYTEALGKFLPDQDRPNAGVFSFQDDESDLSPNRPEQWLSLRYDLTAPLARYVAENAQKLPTPFRSYRQGWVFRNEKPGPGRYRQFMQFDADTVGSSSPAADAEVCMMAADTMEALGIDQYRINVNNRKILEGIFESIGLTEPSHAPTKLVTLRAIDKLDRLGELGLKQLLGVGRKDESGDFTEGAKLTESQIDFIMKLFAGNLSGGRLLDNALNIDNVKLLDRWETQIVGQSKTGAEGIAELRQMFELIERSSYGTNRIQFAPEVVRGLEYYTGPVFECELLMETKDEKGNPVRFGSVGGGGRYDDLVARFTGQQVPATGFSIGVSRLYSALEHLKKNKASDTLAPVVVTVMDKERQGDYWKLVQTLRQADIRAEMYIGTSNMQKQMKYADKRNAPLVIIQGADEKAKGEVQIKDLRRGSELASEIESREEYASQRLAQKSVAEADMVSEVLSMLNRK
jgi:histidyl-tRNA synthetase